MEVGRTYSMNLRHATVSFHNSNSALRDAQLLPQDKACFRVFHSTQHTAYGPICASYRLCENQQVMHEGNGKPSD